MIKQLTAVALLFTAGYALGGTGQANYETKRIPMGPRPDQYVLVRKHPAPLQQDRPYALTGEREHRRAVQPSHPKGTHGQY